MDGDDEHVGEKEMSGLAKCECGGAPHVWENSPPRAFSATCRACGANGPWKATRPGAVAAWNALPRRSDVAAAFREGFETAVFNGDWMPVSAAREKVGARLAELNGGVLPKHYTAADVVAAEERAKKAEDALRSIVKNGDERFTWARKHGFNARTMTDLLAQWERADISIGYLVEQLRLLAYAARQADVVAAMREALEICKRHMRMLTLGNAEAAINARIAEYEGKAKR